MEWRYRPCGYPWLLLPSALAALALLGILSFRAVGRLFTGPGPVGYNGEGERIFQMTKRGFTLVEAMVMILMAAILIVPVVGVMTNTGTSIRAAELRNFMQNLAEAKMAQLFHDAMFSQQMPVSQTAYPVPYPSVDPEFNIMVSTEVSEPITISGQTSSTYDFLEGPQPAGLMAVSVQVWLAEPEPEIATITLFSLISPPTPPPDLIYLCAPVAKQILVVHPISHETLKTYDLPFPPMYAAVHPNREYLAVKCPKHILLVKIQEPNEGTVYIAYDAGAGDICLSNVAATGDNNARLDRGLVFRSDGKYLYFTHASLNCLMMLTVPSNLPGCPWSSTPLSPVLSSNRTTDMELLQNGMIAITSKPGVTNNEVRFFNTHNHTMVSKFIGATTAKETVTGSRDGRYVYYREGSDTITEGLYDAPTLQYSGDFTGSTFGGANEKFDMVVTPDNMWLVIAGIRSGNQEHLFAFKRPLEAFQNPINLALLGGSATPGSRRFAKSKNLDGIITLYVSPYSKELVGISQSSKVFYPNIEKLAKGSYESTLMPYKEYSETMSDAACREPELVWIACSDGSTKHQVECVDIYRSPGMFLDKNRQIPLTARPRFIYPTAGADQIEICLDGTNAPRPLDPVTCYLADHTPALVMPTSGNPVKAYRLLDRSMLVLLENSASTWNGDFPGTITNVNNITNGFLLFRADSTGNLESTAWLGYNLPGTEGYKIRHAEPLRRHDGAYVLISKDANAQDGVLFWIEKSASGGLTGAEGTNVYRIMNMWQTKFDGFPEGNPTHFALSYDDGLMVIHDNYGNGTKQMFRLYDLQNQRFPMQHGLIFANYVDSTGGFQPENTSPEPIRHIKRRMTRYMDTAPDVIDQQHLEPINLTGTANLAFIKPRTSRFFGHWFLETTTQALGVFGADGFRFIIDNTIKQAQAAADHTDTWVNLNNRNAAKFDWTLAPGSRNFEYQHLVTAGTTFSISGYSPTSVSGYPTGYTGSPGNRVPVGGAGASWKAMTSKKFRAFRFRPQLLMEQLLTGGPVPDASSGYQSPEYCFHRDLSRATLFIFDDLNEKLYGLGLFGNPNWATLHLPSDPYLSSKGFNSDSDFCQLGVSPDGRRLLILSNDSGPDGVISFDIAYPTPYSTSLSFSNPRFVSLPLEPIAMTLRPFNAFQSQPDSYDTITPVSGTMVKGAGNHRATLGNYGIYVIGGAQGVDGTLAANTLARFDPVKQEVVSQGWSVAGLREQAQVCYNDTVFAFGGRILGTTQAKVLAIPASPFPIVPDVTSYKNLQTNARTDAPRRNFGACLTPYGITLFGGQEDPPIWDYEFDHSTTPSLGATSDFTFASGGNSDRWEDEFSDLGSGNGTLALDLGDDTEEFGAVYLQTTFNINGNTSFRTKFKVRQFEKDGIAFIVQNNANGFNAIGGNNNSKGYCYIKNAMVIVLDSKPGQNFIGVTTNLSHVDYSDFPSSAMFQNTAWYNAAAQTQNRFIWANYDGVSDILKVWLNTIDDFSSALQIIPDYTVDLTAVLAGTTAKFGFTGASNDGDGHQYVISWRLSLDISQPPADNQTRVYYPGAFNSTAGPGRWGETLAMGTLAVPAAMNAGVCHYSQRDGKYYLFSVGGNAGVAGTPIPALIQKYDFDNTVWLPYDLTAATHDIRSDSPAGASVLNRRDQAAACSWGDEIFIFGGAYAGTATNRAIAYNPDTNRYRVLTNLPANLTYSAAVPVGPYIYLIGGAPSPSGTSDAVNTIYRYSP
ncbi:MAG: hypothetical protein OZSIB_2822 [Candidatus Ozemobacter sibiricus]|uniref:Legume lectin domain-containing protein n=1 Tax=Candidatus Ozemobacter sibiricus TaxID=2268124 RepID=A0A367ZS13_9BACT|nr:MAG: hypothetical protein OZSIB_2822 [Candidatus Ozemobacter sibiricus]